MKKTHIIILIGIAALIAGLLTFSVDFSSAETINSAKNKKGKTVSLMVKLDKSQPLVFDPINNPNYLSFYAKDSLGSQVKVVYHDSKPTDFERSENIVMTGRMTDDHFECSKILLKCPSKYKDDKKQLEKNMSEQTAASGQSNN